MRERMHNNFICLFIGKCHKISTQRRDTAGLIISISAKNVSWP